MQLFRDERELRMRKLRMRCGFCVRGERRFGASCARSRRCAAERNPDDSDYESSGASAGDDSSTDSAGEGSALAGGSDIGEGEGWRTQGSSGAAPNARDYGSGDDGCSDGGTTEAGSLRSGSSTRGRRRRSFVVWGCSVVELTFALTEARRVGNGSGGSGSSGARGGGTASGAGSSPERGNM